LQGGVLPWLGVNLVWRAALGGLSTPVKSQAKSAFWPTLPRPMRNTRRPPPPGPVRPGSWAGHGCNGSACVCAENWRPVATPCSVWSHGVKTAISRERTFSSSEFGLPSSGNLEPYCADTLHGCVYEIGTPTHRLRGHAP